MGKRGIVPRTSSASSRLRASVALLGFACSVYDAPAGSDGAPSTDMSGAAGISSHAGSSSSGRGGLGGQASSAGQSGTGGLTGGTRAMGGTVSVGDGVAGVPPAETGGASGEGGGGGGGGEGGGAPPPVDACPNDPAKLEPGACGCGIPEVATAALADCHTLKAKLVHRYDFEGTGAAVKDRVGTADGTVQGATLSGKGTVSLTGGSAGPYVDLPNKLVSALTNATLEAWLTWGGGNEWQRIFDFGASSSSTEGTPAYGTTYLFATPQSSNGIALAGYSANGYQNELDASAPAALSSTAISHVAMVVDDTGDKLTIYVNGKSAGVAAWTGTLSAINDINCWLGRSQFDANDELSAVFHEFRIYNAALSAAELATSFKAGPDPSFLAY